MFIPEKLLSKEEEHVKGFSPEVAWVTEAGNTNYLKDWLFARHLRQ
jgi:prolyl-tRNA synthetase